MADVLPLRDRPAWSALQAHYDELSAAHLRDLFATDPGRAERFSADAVGLHLDYSKNRIDDETLRLLVELAERVRTARADRRDVPRRPHQRHRGPRRAPRRAAHAARRVARGRRRGRRRRRSTRSSTGWRRSPTRVRSGAWTGHTGKRIRTVVNIGIGGSDLGPVMAYEALRRTRDRDLTFRFVSNVDVDRLRRGDPRPRPGRDAVHHRVEDVHDARDDDQRRVPRASGSLAALGDEAAVAKHFVAVSTNAERGGGVRHRHRQHVRVLGLGRRPLLDGLGDRALDDDRDRARAVRRACSPASTRWTSTSAPRRSTQNLPVLMGLLGVWYGDFFGAQTVGGAALRASTSSASRRTCSSSTMESNGKHVDARRRAGRLRHRRRVLGRAGDERPARFYQLIHQGTTLIPVDLIGFGKTLNPLRRPPRPADRPTSSRRPRRWRSARPPRRSRAEGTPDQRRPAPRVRGQPPDQHDPRRDAHAALPRHAGRALRAQRVHAGRDLGHRLVRPVGRRARQGARAADRRRELESADEPDARPRLVDERADPPLPPAQGEPTPDTEHPDAARHDRPRPDGRQPRPPADATTATTASSTTSNADAVAGARRRGRDAAPTRSPTSSPSSTQPRAVWVMVPAALVAGARSTSSSALLEPGDIVIDGGNSYYRDDIARARAAREPRASTTSTAARSGGVWGLERGYCLMIGGEDEPVERLDPIFADDRARRRRAPSRRPAATGDRRHRAEDGYLHCGPNGAGHFVKMVHNGIEYGMMAAYRRGPDSSSTPTPARRPHEIDAETTPLRDPEFYQYDIDVAEVAEVWRRGSRRRLVALDLTAAALAGVAGPRGLRRPRVGLGRGPLDRAWRRSRRASRRRRHHRGALRALRVARPRRVRRQGPVGDAQPSSAATPRSRPPDGPAGPRRPRHRPLRGDGRPRGAQAAAGRLPAREAGLMPARLPDHRHRARAERRRVQAHARDAVGGSSRTRRVVPRRRRSMPRSLPSWRREDHDPLAAAVEAAAGELGGAPRRLLYLVDPAERVRIRVGAIGDAGLAERRHGDPGEAVRHGPRLGRALNATSARRLRRGADLPASTTSSARRTCRTSRARGSRTAVRADLDRDHVATSRSTCPRRSASRTAAQFYEPPARSATWSSPTCSRCSASWRWSRRSPLQPDPCDREAKVFDAISRSTRRAWCAASTRATAPTRTCRTLRHRDVVAVRGPIDNGAGPACRSTCAPGSGCSVGGA